MRLALHGRAVAGGHDTANPGPRLDFGPDSAPCHGGYSVSGSGRDRRISGRDQGQCPSPLCSRPGPSHVQHWRSHRFRSSADATGTTAGFGLLRRRLQPMCLRSAWRGHGTLSAGIGAMAGAAIGVL